MHESALGYLECIRVHEIVLATWVKGVHLDGGSALVSCKCPCIARSKCSSTDCLTSGFVFSWGFMDINIHYNEYRQLVLQIKLSKMKQTTQL